jgi:LuxR family maltose regulon positive regulatory protein
VERTTLIERVRSATDARVVAVVAPAGYGKSTFLAQWMERDPRSGAWLTIDRYDGDPAVLLTDVGLALQQAGLLAADVLSDVRFTSKNALSHGVWELTSRLEDAPSGILFLDQADSLG